MRVAWVSVAAASISDAVISGVAVLAQPSAV